MIDDLLGGAEWQTVAIYAMLALIISLAFIRWHRSNNKFCMMHAFTDREGFYDQDKTHLTGAFLVTTFAVVVSVIRNAITIEVGMAVAGYSSVWALKKGWNAAVTSRNIAEVQREEIRASAQVDIDPTETDDMREFARESKAQRKKSVFR